MFRFMIALMVSWMLCLFPGWSEADDEVIEIEPVIVTDTRAVDRETPVAFTNISRKSIEQKYWAQEIPMLLDEVPGLYSYSLTGSGLGYSEVRIRGFDANHVAVSINGVPLNDPEDHATYFYDLPDLSANVEDIQVQRGVGSLLYGPVSSFGGSVNLVTRGRKEQKYLTFQSTIGSYNTRRYSTDFSTGEMDGTYSTYGRFAKIDSDGYRDRSWTHGWSYFLSGSRDDKNMQTTVSLFGGPIRAHFAWNGITREQLETDRTYNPYEYEHAADDFLQQHYQIINEWRISDKVQLNNTLFHVNGEGFYESLKTRRKLSEYNLPSFSTSDPEFLGEDDRYYAAEDTDGDGNVDRYTLKRTDLVRRKWVDKRQFGWLPRVRIQHGKGELAVGGELSLFDAEHFGEVLWAKYLSQAANPRNRYYTYNTDKISTSVFLQELYRLTKQVNLFGALQFQHHTFKLRLNAEDYPVYTPYDYTIRYNFLMPRVGVNYNLNDAMQLFVSFSVARREPRDSDIHDADDPGSAPLFGTMDVANGVYEDPLVKPETLYDTELGMGYRKGRIGVMVNGYWMDFRDEIVPTGQLNDNDEPIFGNAPKSVHRGVELSLSAKLPASLTFSGHVSLSDNTFSEYTEYDYDANWKVVALDRSGNTIAGFPALLSNARLTYKCEGFYSSIQVRRVGRIYADHSESEEHSIDPYSVINLSVGYDLSQRLGTPTSLNLHINNLLDTEYETYGATYGGVSYYIPAAERSFYLVLKASI